MKAPKLPAPGELLAQRYRVVRLIGEGGMGAVLEAENTLTQKRVAIKVLHPELANNSEAAQRLLREAQASCRVRHQNVVDVYDVVSEGDALFLIMELLEGEPLSALLERGGVPAHEFIGTLLQAMRGVAAVHRVGVIHRDIHPGNIFLAREPPNALLVPKVLDFGISKILDDHERALTGSGVMMGTPQYMSYEQLCSARDIDGRTDVYSFGVILYQAMTGQAPFTANVLTELFVKIATTSPTPPKQLCPALPGALDRLICWAIERDCALRLPSIDAFITELEPFASERAFRSQMTDPHHTIPAVVPRAGMPASAASEPPPEKRASERPPERVSERPAAQPSERPPARVSERPAARASDRPPDSSSAAPAAQTRSTRQSQLLPVAFVVAATLAVMGLGTYVVRRLSAPALRPQRVVVPAPPQVPFFAADAGLGAPAAAGRADLPRQASTPRAEVAPTRDAAPGPALAARPVPPPPDLATAATAARSGDAGQAESAPPARPLNKSKEGPLKTAPKRRFRAGEARPIDF